MNRKHVIWFGAIAGLVALVSWLCYDLPDRTVRSDCRVCAICCGNHVTVRKAAKLFGTEIPYDMSEKFTPCDVFMQDLNYPHKHQWCIDHVHITYYSPWHRKIETGCGNNQLNGFPQNQETLSMSILLDMEAFKHLPRQTRMDIHRKLLKCRTEEEKDEMLEQLLAQSRAKTPSSE